MWYIITAIASLVIGMLLGMYFIRLEAKNLNWIARIFFVLLAILRKLKRNMIELLIISMTILSFGAVIYLKFNLSINDINNTINSYEIILTFFTSFIFAWILTKYGGNIQLREREKELAIRSFRHSRSLISKIEYSIKISELLNEQATECINRNGIECLFADNLKRTRDLLITFKKDATENKNDWADTISKDIASYQELDKIESQIKKLAPVTQDEQSNETDIEKNKKEIEKLKRDRENLLLEVDERIKLALEESSKTDDEILEYINIERKFNDVRKNRIKSKKDIDIPDRNSYIEEQNQYQENA